ARWRHRPLLGQLAGINPSGICLASPAQTDPASAARGGVPLWPAPRYNEVCNPSPVPAAKPFSDASTTCRPRTSACAANSTRRPAPVGARPPFRKGPSHCRTQETRPQAWGGGDRLESRPRPAAPATTGTPPVRSDNREPEHVRDVRVQRMVVVQDDRVILDL